MSFEATPMDIRTVVSHSTRIRSIVCINWCGIEMLSRPLNMKDKLECVATVLEFVKDVRRSYPRCTIFVADDLTRLCDIPADMLNPSTSCDQQPPSLP
jgi:hypothetical protein